MLPTCRTQSSNPFSFFREFDRAVNRLWDEAPALNVGTGTFAVDVHEADDTLVVEAELPGYRKDQIRVNVEQGVLTIEANRAAPDDAGQVEVLYLRAGGDPGLTTEEFGRLAAELRRTGLRRVTGGLVIDDTAFDTARPRSGGIRRLTFGRFQPSDDLSKAFWNYRLELQQFLHVWRGRVFALRAMYSRIDEEDIHFQRMMVNDDPDLWAEMWREEVRQGMVPYYMFVERDTGAREYFHLPLARALRVYRGAIKQVSDPYLDVAFLFRREFQSRVIVAALHIVVARELIS